MKSAEKRLLVEEYLQAYNEMSVDGMLKVLHPEIQFQHVAGGKVMASTSGIGAFRSLAEQGVAMFEERTQQVQAIRESRNTIILTVEFRGRLRVPPAGSDGELRLVGTSEFSFGDLKISRIVDRA